VEGQEEHAPTLEAGQAFYQDIKARAVAQGRNPERILILPGVSPIIGDSDEDVPPVRRTSGR